MDEDNRKDICDEEIDYSYISLISKKLRVGIIGGGKAGAIKTKHFVNNKCYVEVLSNAFEEEIIELSNVFKDRVSLRNEELSFQFLRDKHIIIIALEDETIKGEVKSYCEENYKIYIDSSNFTDGMGVVPIQKSTKNITFALNTNFGNPKGAVLVSNKVKNLLEEYDEFMKYVGIIRNRAKTLPKYKKEIISFINNEEFKKYFDEGESESLLKDNFPKEIVDYLLDF